MIAIWPAGPPNEMNPSLSQKRNASPSGTPRGSTCGSLPCFVCTKHTARRTSPCLARASRPHRRQAGMAAAFERQHANRYAVEALEVLRVDHVGGRPERERAAFGEQQGALR